MNHVKVKSSITNDPQFNQPIFKIGFIFQYWDIYYTYSLVYIKISSSSYLNKHFYELSITSFRQSSRFFVGFSHITYQIRNKCWIITSKMHQLYLIFHQKSPLIFKIWAILLPEFVYTYTQKKKKTRNSYKIDKFLVPLRI